MTQWHMDSPSNTVLKWFTTHHLTTLSSTYIYFVCDAITSFRASCYGLWNLGKRPRIDSAWSSMLLTLALMMTSIFSWHNGRVAKHLSAKRLVVPCRLSTCQSEFFGEAICGPFGWIRNFRNRLSNAPSLKAWRHSKCCKLIFVHYAMIVDCTCNQKPIK